MHRPRLYITVVLFLVLTSHLAPILSTTITPFEIDDLFSTDQASFATEASSWVAYPTQLTTYVYSNCGGTYIVGGYGVGAGSDPESVGSYYGRVYEGLAPHTMIYFSFQLWALDTWDISGADGPDGGDRFYLYFSGTILDGIPMDQGTFTVNECGLSYPDSIMTIQGNVQHISTVLDFRIYNHFDENSENESLGFRKVTLMMSNAPAQDDSICSPDTPNTSYRCTNSCPDGYYWNGVGCAACDYYCALCFGAGTTNCYQCQNGAVWDGSECVLCNSACATCYGGDDDQCLTCSAAYPYMYDGNTCLASCPSPLIASGSVCGLPCPPNQYLYPDGTCLVECDFPLEAITTTTTVGVVNECTSPCNGSDYMYWEADCRSTCALPLEAITEYGINYCEFPCDPSTLILYWNGTCETSCDFPLEYANRFSAAFCDYPCADNEYLYDNGTCSSICQDYFLTDAVDDPSGKLYCYYPCSSTQTLYNNGSCLGTCDWRFTNYTLWPDWYCDYPCSSAQYLYTNGSCLDTCDPRFGLTTDSVTGDQYCNYPCADSQYLDSNGTCSESCDNYFYPYYLWDEMYCDYPCQSTQYLLSNGTCVDNCDPDYAYFNPLSVSGLTLRIGDTVVENYCSYPCLPNEYLYSNGSCLTSCQPLYIPSSYSRDKFCDYPCQYTEYLYYNGTCLSSCPSTFDSYPLTPPSSDLYCDNPCKPPDFIYPNGTCLSYCPIPYVQEFYGADSYCIFPCSTTTPIEYLYINGSCESTCLSYYSQRIEGDEHFCDYPCEPEDYLYYNHTCLSSCKSPFVLSVVNGENFCDYPCTTTSDFIYWNGSCLSSCPAPLQSVYEGTSNFCTYPCETDQFLYWTGICLDTCPFPLSTITMTDGLQYCNNPCSVSEYLSWNGSCLSQCSEPFRALDNGLGRRCELPCDDSDYYYDEGTKECSATCDGVTTLVQEIYLSCGSLSSIAFLEFLSTPPTEPNTITYIMLANSVKYLRYLDITISSRLEGLTLGQGKAPISLLYNYNVPSDIENQLPQSIRTRLLAQTDVPASFLVNFWPEILMLAILVFCAVLFTLAEALADRLGLAEVRVVLERFRVVLKWNIPLILLSTTLGDVILYSAFEFETLSLESAANIISMIICISLILLELLVLAAGYFLASKAYNLKVNSLRTQSYKDYAAFLLKWEGLQVVYRGFAVHHKLCYYFFLFYTVRMALPMLIAAYIPSPPLLQTMLFLIISIITISYLHFFRPLRKKITRIQFMISELLMLFVNIGLVILASLDLKENNSDSISAVIGIGDIIIVLNFCLCIFPTVFLVIKLISVGSAAYRLRNVSPEQSKALWLQLIFVPIQQAGFGFEQVQIVPHTIKYTRIDDLNLTRPPSAIDKGNSIIEQDESAQTYLYNVKNPAKRMRVPEIIKSNIKELHEKDYKPEYKTFAPKVVAGEAAEENLDPFSVSHDLPRNKEIGRNIDTKDVGYVYGATEGFGHVGE